MKNGNRPKVLIVDDDKSTGEMLKLVLEPHYFQVSEVITGLDGIYAAKEFTPDVIILDLLKPEMDSRSVVKEIRAFSHAPILVLSAISKPDMVVKALNDGVDEYLRKPIPTNVLVANLNRLARRARAEVSSNI